MNVINITPGEPLGIVGIDIMTKRGSNHQQALDDLLVLFFYPQFGLVMIGKNFFLDL